MASFKEQLLEKYSGGSTSGTTGSTSFKEQLLEKYTPEVQKPVTIQQLDNAVQQTLSQNRSAAQNAGSALTNIRSSSPAYAAGQRSTPSTLMQKATGGIYDNPSRKAAHQDSIQALPEKQSIGKTVFDVADRGAGYFNQGVANTADFVANLLPRAEGAIFGVDPAATFTGQVLKPVTNATGKFKDYVDNTVQNINARIQNDTRDSKAAQVAADLGSGTVAAIPNAILAMMSGGASAAGTLAPQATGAAATASAAVKKLASNPMFKTSAIQTLGSSYEDAKADGATDEQAIVAAVLSTAFNAAVEVGGGVEVLPGQLDNADLSTGQKALKWVASMLDEGKEEVVQDVISGLTEKAVYDQDRALFSKSIHADEDEGAVISPGRMAQEFGMGAAIGGILGGGQLLSDILPSGNNATPSQSQVDKAIQETLGQNKAAASEAVTVSPLNGSESSNAAVGAENNITQETPAFNASWENFMEKHKGQPSVSDYLEFGRQLDNDADANSFVAFLDQQERDGKLKWRSDGAPGRVMPAEDHIDRRDYGSVGDPKIKSFQYNNPELQPYMREGLEILADDLDRSIPGQRFYNGLDPNGVGSQGKWSGQKRHTTPEIAKLKDDYGMSWADINKAFEDLYKDAGRENNANAKRLELVVDKILTEGHRTLGGVEISPNQGYIDAKSRIDGYTPKAKTSSAIDDDFMRHEFGESGSKPAMGAADYGFDPYSNAANTYGAIEPGENPARVVDVPKSMDGESNVMQTVRTIMEADVTPDAAVPVLENEIVKGSFSAMPITDQAAAARAEATIKQVGYGQALADWRAEVRAGRVSKDSVAIGETLYNAAVSAGDTKSAVKIAIDLSTQVRSAAQALQAVRMLKKMSPAAQLYGVKQSVDNLQKQLQGQYGDRAPDLKIDETMAANFLNAQTDAERTAAEEALYKDIARQIPATFSDKWNAWRYLSMLGNPRTHIRNILGNAMFAPVRGVKNQVGGLMETIAQGVGIIDKSQRTKSAGFNWSKKRRALVQAAKADYANVEGQIQSGDKYNSATDIIEKNRRIFDNAVRETLRRGNSTALDVEDTWFSKGAYARSLAGYLNARGYTAEDFTGKGMTEQQKDDARAYAILEAQKATYRDLNALSELVTSMKFKDPANSRTKYGEVAKRAANTVIEGVLPFKKTPANILARAVEYSPAGLAKALTVDSIQVAQGKITAGEYMDHLASGLTGTGLFALGYFLAQSGMLVGGDPEDEDQFDLEGRQPYALEVGGTSVTLDWLAPEALPVFMGVELCKAIEAVNGQAFSVETMKSFFRGVTGPLLEMSMLSGLQDALDAVSYADDKMTAVVANAALGYLGQAVPTLFGQVERVIGNNAETRQTTFTQDGQFLDKDTQYALGNTLNKVPFLDFQQIPYIDAWGRTESTGGVGTRAANNLINPAYVSEVTETAVDAEIKRLEKSTGENLTPARADKVLTVNGEKILLTADEYVTYATAKGQNDYTFREHLIDREDYAALDDNTKAKAMEYAKRYADALAREETGLNPEMAEWMAELEGADIETATRRFVEKAVEAMAGDKNLYDNKYDGISGLLNDGTIDDEIAIAIMPDDAVDGYMKYCKSAGITAKQYVDAYAYKNTLTGDTTKTDFLDYLSRQSMSPAQKVAIAQSQYKELPSQWLLDNKASDDVIYESLTDEKKAKYDDMISSDAGLDMKDFLNIAAYRESLSTKVLDNGEKYSVQNQMIDYLDGTYGNDNRKKIAAFLTVYDSKRNIPDWWK